MRSQAFPASLTMRDIIQSHNRLNSIVFSVSEFGFVALFVGAFAAYYLCHARIGMGLIASGIALNCLPVLILGLRQLAQDRADAKALASFWGKRAREQHQREYPDMLRDTLILTLGTLLPFVSLAADEH